MPSIAAESKAGEDRIAHTDTAVTRPTASSTRISTASTRGGQPAAAHASRHACRACSAGMSETNGLGGVTWITVDGIRDRDGRWQGGGRLSYRAYSSRP